MTRAMHRLVIVGLEDATFILEGSHRTNGRSGILHAVSIVVARARGVGEIIDAVTLKHEGCFEYVFQFGVGNEPLLAEFCAIHLCDATAEVLIDAPRTEVEILLTVFIAEELGIERDGIVDKAVWNEHGIVTSKDIAPRTYG